MVCDFYHFHVYNESGAKATFTLPELIENIQLFASIAGYLKIIQGVTSRTSRKHTGSKTLGQTAAQTKIYWLRAA